MKKIGEKIGRLTIIKEVGKAKDGHKLFLCKCECGNEVSVASNNFRNTKSCGCLRKEIQSKKAKKHGLSQERIYKEYYRMMTRCYNNKTKNFKNWGGKGIRVCDDWRKDKMNFINWAFGNGYKENLTLDRIDNNKDYSPENCRWVTMQKQMENKTNNVFVNVDGENIQLSLFCRENNLSYSSIHGKVIRRNKTLLINNKIIKKGD